MQELSYIGCISLKNREDRFLNAKKQFNKINVLNKVNFIRPNKHELGGRVGCYDSHLQLYRHCINNGYDYALIFEDDICIINKNIEKTLKNLEYIMNNNKDWDLMLCHDSGVFQIYEKINKNLYNGKSLFTPCYFISKNAMKEMLLEGITKNHIDNQLQFKFNSKNIYISRPGLVKTISLGTDNSDYGNNNLAKIVFRLAKYTNVFSKLPYKLCENFPNSNFSSFMLNKLKSHYNEHKGQMNINLNNCEIAPVK